MHCKNEKCQITFDPKNKLQKFCSVKCRGYTNQRKLRNAKSGSCKHCNTKLKTLESTCCKKCMNLDQTNSLKNMTFSEFIDKMKSIRCYPGSYSRPIRGFARSWNAQLLKEPCQVCGYSVHIELAHRTAIASSQPDMTLGEINSPDNIFVLCRNHHWEYDNNILNVDNIPPRSKNT